jgi:hypothetical protein
VTWLYWLRIPLAFLVIATAVVFVWWSAREDF